MIGGNGKHLGGQLKLAAVAQDLPENGSAGRFAITILSGFRILPGQADVLVRRLDCQSLCLLRLAAPARS
ncbi:MAG: hypothetical protein H8E37_11450 [Planctomycetes bacterium]|nr:hypothetical protein [Planctomycetota bacterium]